MMKIAYKGFIYESTNHAQNLIVVDIQPEYEKSFTFKKYTFGNWINSNYHNYQNIVFLFNGPELGFPDEMEYKMWLYESCGIEEDVLDGITFFDKGYAFFRNAMDNEYSRGDIVKLVQWMLDNKIHDSRDIEPEMTSGLGIDDLVASVSDENGDALFIPDVLEVLRGIRGTIDIMGGGRNECLAEVEICLMSLLKTYNVIEEFTY